MQRVLNLEWFVYIFKSESDILLLSWEEKQTSATGPEKSVRVFSSWTFNSVRIFSSRIFGQFFPIVFWKSADFYVWSWWESSLHWPHIVRQYRNDIYAMLPEEKKQQWYSRNNERTLTMGQGRYGRHILSRVGQFRSLLTTVAFQGKIGPWSMWSAWPTDHVTGC